MEQEMTMHQQLVKLNKPETSKTFTLPEGITEEDVLKALKKAKVPTKEDTNSYVEFACIESGHDQQIRVYRDIFKGRELLSIRRFYLDSEAGEYRPAKGVTFHDEDIQDIIEGLQKMDGWLVEAEARGFGGSKEPRSESKSKRFEQGDD